VRCEAWIAGFFSVLKCFGGRGRGTLFFRPVWCVMHLWRKQGNTGGIVCMAGVAEVADAGSDTSSLGIAALLAMLLHFPAVGEARAGAA
jgi:hypothetical protein